jgi:hypothetical protein
LLCKVFLIRSPSSSCGANAHFKNNPRYSQHAPMHSLNGVTVNVALTPTERKRLLKANGKCCGGGGGGGGPTLPPICPTQCG